MVVACALHGLAFWLLHTPARSTRSSMVPRPVLALDRPVLHLDGLPLVTQTTPRRKTRLAPPPPVPAPVVPTPVAVPTEVDASVENAQTTYYSPSTELEVQPVVVQDIANDPPELAGRTDTGTMVLNVLIGANGVVDEVTVESSDLPEMYAEVARRDFLAARFTPGLRNGQAVPTAMRIEVTFGPAAVQP